jgi:ubiquinone/menaquinone biosynthesis C-methylase UbiE
MENGETAMTKYSLGTDDPEINRLDVQATWLEGATRMLLRAAGIAPGMRVLDLGCGLGHVSFLAAELTGPEGRVVGLDSSARLLEIAASRASSFPQVTFVEGDVRTWRGDEPFDAVVGRLILFHLPDVQAVLKHQLAGLRRGGLVVGLDFDLGAIRADPQVPVVAESTARVIAAFKSAGADPTIGARLGRILGDAGVTEPKTFGYQDYLGPTDPRAPAMLTAVVRSLAPQMARAGIATPEELGLDTLMERIAVGIRDAASIFVPPVLVGAWGQLP